MRVRKDASITIRVPRKIRDALQAVADAERRSFSQMVLLVLEQYLESPHERRPPIPRPKRASARRR